VSRAWTYLQERFPPLPSALLTAVYVGGGAAVVRALGVDVAWWRAALAGAVVFLFLLQLRLGDESKDYHKDLELHPERPVQRGLVTLAEVRRAEMAVAIAQAILAAVLGLTAIGAWAALALYGFFMRREFFAGRLLEPRPIAYALTHQPVMLLLTGFIQVAVGAAPGDLTARVPLLHQALSLGLMFAYEVSRKLRAPADEDARNPTYSQVHGPRVAGMMAAGLLAAAVVALAGLLGRGYLSALGLALPALFYAARPTAGAAKIARVSAEGALLLLHAALAARLWSAW